MGDPHVGDARHTSFDSQICSVFRHPLKKDLYIALADRWLTDLPDERPDIAKYFDTMVFGEDTVRSKPYGDPIVEGAKRLGITDMSRVLYVGDAKSDLLSAKDCGASFALVDWTMMPKDEIGKLGPDHVISSLDEIPCIIGGTEL